MQVQFWAPKAGGGGVTLVMAFLNGNAVPDLLTPRTLAAKFAGVLCGCASGLAVGPEGPMVQLGACVASIVSTAQAGAPATSAMCSGLRCRPAGMFTARPLAGCCL